MLRFKTGSIFSKRPRLNEQCSALSLTFVLNFFNFQSITPPRMMTKTKQEYKIMTRLIRMDEISIITSLHYARKNKYRMQKEKRLLAMLFKN